MTAVSAASSRQRMRTARECPARTAQNSSTARSTAATSTSCMKPLRAYSAQPPSMAAASAPPKRYSNCTAANRA